MTASLYQRFSLCIPNPCFSCCAFVSMMKSAQRTQAVPFGFCFPPVPRHRAERALHDARVPPSRKAYSHPGKTTSPVGREDAQQSLIIYVWLRVNTQFVLVAQPGQPARRQGAARHDVPDSPLVTTIFLTPQSSFC